MIGGARADSPSQQQPQHGSRTTAKRDLYVASQLSFFDTSFNCWNVQAPYLVYMPGNCGYNFGDQWAGPCTNTEVVCGEMATVCVEQQFSNGLAGADNKTIPGDLQCTRPSLPEIPPGYSTSYVIAVADWQSVAFFDIPASDYQFAFLATNLVEPTAAGGQDGTCQPITGTVGTPAYRDGVNFYRATCYLGSPVLQLCQGVNCTGCTTYSYSFSEWSQVSADGPIAIPELGHGTPVSNFYLACMSGTSPASVYVTTSVDRISSLDSAASSFAARTWLYFQWYPNDMIVFARYSAVAAIQTPQFFVTSATGGSPSLVSSGSYIFGASWAMWSLWVIDSEYYYTYNMQPFPFDAHQLQIESVSLDAQSLTKFTDVALIPQAASSSIPTLSFSVDAVDLPQSFLIDHRYSGGVNVNSTTFNGELVSSVVLTIPVQRQSKPFVEDIVIVALTFVLTLAVFFMDIDDPNRILGTITGFLTVVAYSFIINSNMPEAGYLNRMQYILNVTYVALAILVIYHGIAARTSKNLDAYHSLTKYRDKLRGRRSTTSSTARSTLEMMESGSTARLKRANSIQSSEEKVIASSDDDADEDMSDSDELTDKARKWVSANRNRSGAHFFFYIAFTSLSPLRRFDMLLGFVIAPLLYALMCCVYLLWY